MGRGKIEITCRNPSPYRLKAPVDPFTRENYKPSASQVVSLIGMGSRSISRGFRGEFKQWQITPGTCDPSPMMSNQFSVSSYVLMGIPLKIVLHENCNNKKIVNKFYHSHLDDLSNINSSYVVAATFVMARTLYILASDSKDTSNSALGSIHVNASFVEEILAILLSCEPGLSCNLLCKGFH